MKGDCSDVDRCEVGEVVVVVKLLPGKVNIGSEVVLLTKVISAPFNTSLYHNRLNLLRDFRRIGNHIVLRHLLKVS